METAISRDGDDTRTIELAYSASLPKINFNTMWRLESRIITDHDNNYTIGGVYYLGNFEIPIADISHVKSLVTQPSPPIPR